MKKLITATLLLLTLVGCGANNNMAPTLSSNKTGVVSSSGLFSSFKESNYQEASYATLSSFWDREGSAANDGKKFKTTGKLSCNAPGNFTEGWTATLSSEANGKSEYGYVVSGKYFLTRSSGESYFKKMGAGTEETVTIYYTVKQSSSTKNRIEIDVAKRADGTIAKM